MTTPVRDLAKEDQAKAKRWAWVRVWLGNAQMLFAMMAMILAVLTGLSLGTVVVVTVTCCLTVTSVVLFRFWPWWKRT